MAGVFKAYDIRGIYPSDVNEDLAYKIGRAYVTFVGAKTVVIGRDMRLSSDSLFEALSNGITDQGADVIDIGVSSTPMLYFASGTLKPDGAIMLTASHNPKEYNGFKLTREEVIPIGYDDGIDKIEAMVAKGEFEDAEKGKIEQKDVLEDFRKFMLDKASKRFKFKVVTDSANCMGKIGVDILKDVCNIVPINYELDGNIPNHPANPLELETLDQLRKKVVEEKADLGIAFDGDADRVGFVDEKGEIIGMDLITGLIAGEYSGETIGYDLRSSWAVKEAIEKNNRAVRTRVGHSFIKKAMRKENAIFAGELSGHYYYRETFITESSVLTAMKLMDLLKKSGKTMSELIAPLRKYFQSGEINSDVDDKDSKMNELKEKYSNGKLDELDGVTIEFDDWWFNVRPSNTEPVLRLNLEAKSKELMEDKRDEVLGVIRGS